MPLVPVLAWMEIWGISVDGERLAALGKKMAGKINLLTEKNPQGYRRNIQHKFFPAVGGNNFRQARNKTGQKQKNSDGAPLHFGRGASITQRRSPDNSGDFGIPGNFQNKFHLRRASAPSQRKRWASKNDFYPDRRMTGRLASEKPNLQNVPQESSWSKELRETFVASPGFTFASFDYAQLELRLLAHMTLEEGLALRFRKKPRHSLSDGLARP